LTAVESSNVADATERKLAAAHQVLRHTRGLQLDFAAMPASPPPPPWLKVVLHALQAMAPVMGYIFWGGVIAGAAFLVWIAVRDLIPIRHRRRAPSAPTDWRPAPEAARALLEEADALAEVGRFGEAIHLLLFRSIEDLSAKRPGAIPVAFTSRDIATTAPMPEGARGAFARIAAAVEHSFFGGRAAQAEDFRRCRNDYAAFAFEDGRR
jgi:uncharacterized protein DUF4129